MKKLKTAILASAMALCATVASSADLAIWGLQAFNKDADALITQMAKDFGKAQGLDVQYVIVPANVLTERLASAFEGKAAPDAFMQLGQNSQYYAQNGLTKPIDDVLAGLRARDGGIYESVVPQAIYEGKAHSVPIEIDLVPMFARKDLIAETGLPVPETWEDLRKVTQAIVKKNPHYTGLGLPLSNANDSESQLRMLFWSFGAAMFAEDGKTITWNSPETIAAYQFIKDMYAEGTIPRNVVTWDDGGNNTAYQTGRAAFIMNPPSVYSWMVENDKKLLENSALINIPKGPGEKGRSATLLGTFSWLVSSQTKKEALAKEWINFFFQPENYEKLIQTTGGRWYPVFPAVAKSMPLFRDNPSFANFHDLATNGLPIGYRGTPTPLASQVYTAKILSTSVQQVVIDGKSPHEVAQWVEAEVTKLAAGRK